ncbi:respirasome Complex Assembly Factor 1 [Anopheles arabiensis]|uniref:AGAP004838-PA n=3 Tax=gambiae species complex TaxID=44542 RepID=Q7PCZ1_ANOGA|nr:respirasome Complex Assembly Factor 1 [Anopheles arabiensis]XP_314356.4 GEL complex subunit OPTI [Anopheles gambiae]EAA03352.4 AGAP012695-PA [Anopheles gambiae str. PEST]EAA09701.4 AGAP004838-PA [Anopheles gambiae str. PEST]
MVAKSPNSEKMAKSKQSHIASVWNRAIKPNSEWTEKDDFLDVVYWARQVLSILIGIVMGLIPLKGFIALALFALLNCGAVYLYSTSFQNIDEDAYGGMWEVVKEGFMTSFACFLVTWIIFYTGIHFDSVVIEKSL